MRSTLAVCRFFEGGVGALEDRARVHHQIAIKYQLEEIVAEIVMRRDVAFAARPSVAIEVVDKAADRIRQSRQAAVESFHHGAITNHDLDERGQIVGRPRSRHVRLGRTHGACERQVGIEAMVVDANSRVQIGVENDLAERHPLTAVFNYDVPGFDSRHTAENRPARETIDDRRPTGPRRIDTRCDNGIRLGHRENPPCDTSSMGQHRIEYTRSRHGASAGRGKFGAPGS